MNQPYQSDTTHVTNHAAPGEERQELDGRHPVDIDKGVSTDRQAGVQATVRLLRLADQAERMQRQLDRLVEEVQRSGDQVDVLTTRLTDPSGTQQLNERLVDLFTRLASSEEQLEELASQIKKLSRTQFKANTLAEAQEQKVADALATLQELVTRREEMQRERTLRDQQREAELRAEARGELVADLLPALDGLEAALDNGRALLARRTQERGEVQSQLQEGESVHRRSSSPSLWERVRRALAEDVPDEVVTQVPILVPDPESDRALAAWLEGLELVRERFLALLEREGIQPIPALNQPFDPRLHIAVEAVPRDDVPAHTVVAVVRQGYRQDERVLRYAEVVVAKVPEAAG
ncbi:MAG: nucleotide exchange factor GrpE [Chloroflexota bacterium]|nr:nucleotide exchange factor GrpE [Chloroflexota bacterium]